MIQKAGIRIPGGAKILYAEAITGTPKAVLMFNNRKYRLDAAKQRRENARLRKENDALKNPPKQLRRDSQRQWQVDKRGYFIWTEGNSYLKEGERNIKPDFSIPGTYEMLIKHNGKETIDSIYNV